MSAANVRQPMVPPRPSQSQERSSPPPVPPRPVNRRIERSVSPNPGRFAPSPLNESVFPHKSLNAQPSSRKNVASEGADEHSGSVDMPSLGEEGMEYAGLSAHLSHATQSSTGDVNTHTVTHDLMIHAPKPSWSASSAKQRVQGITRTDSDKAASFGFGRPGSDDAHSSSRSLKKKASTISQLSTAESHTDSEHGIPEIGRQVPMYPNAGDVQAPSPAPGALGSLPTTGVKGKEHARKNSGLAGTLPPGSYGLHGHNVMQKDKLEKAYYEKHPELLKRDYTPYHYDRANDFSLSREDLNKIVRETASRGSSLAREKYAGTLSDQIGWKVMEESTSQLVSPQKQSSDMQSPVQITIEQVGSAGRRTQTPAEGDGIPEEDSSPASRQLLKAECSDEKYPAPILAEDEVARYPTPSDYHAAVELPPERKGSAFEMEEPKSLPASRPASTPRGDAASYERQHTTLDDVAEYEPLFSDEEKLGSAEEASKGRAEHKWRFPSQDVWEDAPSSAHHTAEVSTPEVEQEKMLGSAKTAGHGNVVPSRESNETAAQAFARHQEELAEQEVRERGPDGFLPTHGKKPSWVQHQPHLMSEASSLARQPTSQRFPSRDVWEDTPDSLRLETTVTTPQLAEEPSPDTPLDNLDRKVDNKADMSRQAQSGSSSPTDGKPFISDRPKPKQEPATGESPRPQPPVRPARSGLTPGGSESADAAAPPRRKPTVPLRPMGSKIAALQGGFMNDLNNRLRLGPQQAKKEEVKPEEPAGEEKTREAVPLADARKGRARGRPRRAPLKSTSPARSVSVETDKSGFGISDVRSIFEIDPDKLALIVGKIAETESEDGTKEGNVESIEETKNEAKGEEEEEEEEMVVVEVAVED